MGIQHMITTANHPQINGMVEAIHRQIRDALRAPTLRASGSKDKSAVSLTEIVTGSPLILPGQLLHVSDRPCVDVPPPIRRPTSYAAAANSPPAHLARVEHVYVHVGGKQMPLVASRCRWWSADAVGVQQMPLVASRFRWWPADAVSGQQMPLAASRCRWWPADAVGGQQMPLAAPYSGPHQVGQM
jgi:hypothetical protein